MSDLRRFFTAAFAGRVRTRTGRFATGADSHTYSPFRLC